jgi:hypothetical protein
LLLFAEHIYGTNALYYPASEPPQLERVEDHSPTNEQESFSITPLLKTLASSGQDRAGYRTY